MASVADSACCINSRRLQMAHDMMEWRLTTGRWSELGDLAQGVLVFPRHGLEGQHDDRAVGMLHHVGRQAAPCERLLESICCRVADNQEVDALISQVVTQLCFGIPLCEANMQ